MAAVYNCGTQIGQETVRTGMSEKRDYEVIVVGAGVAGIYQIKCLTDLGVDAILLEGDEDLGGTWYRNRYPGARFDSESYTYGYSFSRELLDEWHWKERFSPQPENLRYLQFVVDKFDLRRHMRFGCRVERMIWNEPERRWHLELTNGEEYVARFVVALELWGKSAAVSVKKGGRGAAGRACS